MRVTEKALFPLAEAERRNQDAESALVTFQIALDGCKGVSKIRNGPAGSGLSDNRSLDTCPACLPETHEHDQVEAWRVRFTTNTKRKVQRGLEAMAVIDLLFGESIRNRIVRTTAPDPDEWTLQSDFDGAELLVRPSIELITVEPKAIRDAESRIVGCE